MSYIMCGVDRRDRAGFAKQQLKRCSEDSAASPVTSDLGRTMTRALVTHLKLGDHMTALHVSSHDRRLYVLMPSAFS